MNKLLLAAMLSTSICASDIADLKLPDFYAPEILKLNDELIEGRSYKKAFAIELYQAATSELFQKQSILIKPTAHCDILPEEPLDELLLLSYMAKGVYDPTDAELLDESIILQLSQTDVAKTSKGIAVEICDRFKEFYYEIKSKIDHVVQRACDEVLPDHILESEKEDYIDAFLDPLDFLTKGPEFLSGAHTKENVEESVIKNLNSRITDS